MPTWTAFTKASLKEDAERLGAALEGVWPEPTGIGVFEMEDGSNLWEIGAYFVDPPDEIALALLAAACNTRPFVVSELPVTDWVAKVRRDLTPVEAGRFFVYGSHDADKLPKDRIGLLIEAAMAFGTGHHDTTLGCLRAIDRLETEGFAPRSVADIGCGTAVLAMAAAKVWPVTPIASDIDPVAVDVARANVECNDLAGRVVCLESAGFENPALRKAAPFDLILANILKGPLLELAPEMARYMAPEGRVVLSGLLTRQAGDIIAAYEAEGFTLDLHEVLGDWSCLTLRRNA
jgi:ribosomal protein L11 methyltransferase